MSKISDQAQRPLGSLNKKITRRSFLENSGKALASGVALSALPMGIGRVYGKESIRVIGLDGASIIKPIEDKASADLGHDIKGFGFGYGQVFLKLLTQQDQWDVTEWWYADMEVMLPAGAFQPIDTKRIKLWDQITNLTKTGKLTAKGQTGQGDAPFHHLWVDEHGKPTKGPSRYISGVPTFHNADSMGYNTKEVAPVTSWGELLNPKYKGRVALVSTPQVGCMDAAMALEAIGEIKFADKGDMTTKEIDVLMKYLISKKKEGHFRAFWENFGQSVSLMASGEVVLQSIWSPAVTALRAEGHPIEFATPKEGMRAFHCAMSISSKVTGKKLDACYDYINWWLEGWAGAFVARIGYYHSIPDNVKKFLAPEEWDYWYAGKPAAKPLKDAFGNEVIKKGEVRGGGSYEEKFSNIAVWNSIMKENEYLVKRWGEFLSA